MNDFLARLKRHHIFRVASVYAIVTWILIQVANGVFPDIGLTRADVRFVIAGVALLFPVVLVVGWMFIPPSKENSDKFSHWQHLRFRVGSVLALIIVVLVIFSGVFLWRANEHYMKAAAVAAATTLATTPVPDATTAIPAKSIAVLPLENLSGDPKQVYFSDGITEEILNALAQIPDLKVAARTSAFQFSSKREDLRKVGETLGVATVLVGSVQKAGDEVRITVQLVDTQSGYQLWSENYDRKLTNIFAVEDEISKAIADKLQVQLTGGSGQSLVVQMAIDPRAHDLYLRGLPLIAARGSGLREAAADFQQAVALDPNYAQAWAALAETQMLLPHYFLEPSETAFPAGEAAAKRALAIDPNVASAYVALGMMYRVQWKWKDADAAFLRALKVAPGDAEAADQYGQFLLGEGQLDQALAQIDRTQRLDPLSGIIAATRTNVLTALHRFGDANVQARSMVAAHSDYALGHFIAADVAIYRHDYAEAKAQLQTGAKLVGENPAVYELLVNGIADPAQRVAARRVVLASNGSAYQRLTAPARIKWLMLLGDHDDALNELQRIGQDVMFGQDNVWQPAFAPVRGDPRFRAALKRMGLPYTPKGLSPG
ncbi:MAG: hypothetical protein WBR15_05060 [Gammaproteobacteria bacterium]